MPHTMSTSSTMSWQRFKYNLQDDEGNPIPINVLPYPTRPLASTNANATVPPTSVRHLCTLPPADVARGMTSPNAVELHNGCLGAWSYGASLVRISVERNCFGFGSASGQEAMDPQCVWDALTQVPNSIDLYHADSRYCLPLDDPALLANNNGRPIVPVPVPDPKDNRTERELLPSARQYDYRMVPVLKHYLASRNHSAANSPIFSNITVRPAHKRLRLGVCVAFPPVGSPCDMSAIDNATNTIAQGWLFPGGSRASSSEFLDVSLARPLADLLPMVGPSLNSLDTISGRSRQSPPYPFLTFRTAEIGSASARWSAFTAWAIPLVACLPSTANSTLGAIRPLLVNGTCSLNRECLSGVCNAANRTCDNSIKPETKSPFSFSFMFLSLSAPTVAFPSNPVTRRILGQYHGSYNPDDLPLPAAWTYYWPLIAAINVVIAALVAACIWKGSGQRFVYRWRQWRTTTQRDMELKPVSGRMVADLGDEAAVEEAVAAAREELPVYVQVCDGNN
ncbi:hypothetical protein BCR44DRAFT_332457 [Catenaria anguillulae PL171]|uniref:Uncharacterized protein n=1 Tax=Catenaria anguillulae PL171 TaxID=765915 RepID=A0A1Y2HN30_9FUNG|nr:hypothetical protein BCR44DRAFT_332457 [Catenaria anguillulae PL171]